MLDTNLDVMNESSIMKQFHIMSDKIKNSNKKWKIVCGHHPWRSVGGHGNAERRLEIFFHDMCKKGADFDLYMCGHDHCKSLVMKRAKGGKEIPIIVCGTGGESYDYNIYPDNMKKDNSKLYFFSPHLGVCLMDITDKRIVYNFYNTKGDIEYSYKYEK